MSLREQTYLSRLRSRQVVCCDEKQDFKFGLITEPFREENVLNNFNNNIRNMILLYFWKDINTLASSTSKHDSTKPCILPR